MHSYQFFLPIFWKKKYLKFEKIPIQKFHIPPPKKIGKIDVSQILEKFIKRNGLNCFLVGEQLYTPAFGVLGFPANLS